MAASPESVEEMDDRIGASGPPAVRDQMQDRQRARVAGIGSVIARFARLAQRTSSASRTRLRAPAHTGMIDRTRAVETRRARNGMVRPPVRDRAARSAPDPSARRAPRPGRPSAAARCAATVSPHTSAAQLREDRGRRSGMSRPTRFTVGALALLRPRPPPHRKAHRAATGTNAQPEQAEPTELDDPLADPADLRQTVGDRDMDADHRAFFCLRRAEWTKITHAPWDARRHTKLGRCQARLRAPAATDAGHPAVAGFVHLMGESRSTGEAARR